MKGATFNFKGNHKVSMTVFLQSNMLLKNKRTRCFEALLKNLDL